MQPTTLLDNLNSDLLSAFSALQPKGTSQRVVVYVESDEDIAFWRNILQPFESHGVNFDILLPIKNGLEKGKIAALEKSQDLLNIAVGTHLIICVDSDYDFLLQGVTETSRKINDSEYIFQTYAYSIENLLCYSENLHSLCVQSTKNDNKMLDLGALVKLYSQIIHKLFLWSVHFRIKQDTVTFPLINFCETVKILEKTDVNEHFKTALEGLSKRVNDKISELEGKFPTEIPFIEKLSENLQSLGVEKHNTYLFAQGHTIKDNVVLMFLNPICLQLRREKEAQIRTNGKHNTEISNQMNFYKKQLTPIDTTLKNNTEFKSCFLFSKIHADLDNYIRNLKNSINA